MATLYGSSTWLRRVFQECLETGIRNTPRAGTLDIEHRQLGPRAVVLSAAGAVSAGATPAKGAGKLAGARPAARSAERVVAPTMHAREQIGLKLCQHIVGLHGGQLREEEEDGLRNFVIDLPTGAPHRNDTTALDIAQAQQYAKDLAALMTRQRRKATAPQ